MKDRNTPNGHNPLNNPAEWSPQDRQLWLAAKGAPPHFRLTTVQEINAVENAVASVERARQALHAGVTGAIAALDEYSMREDQPDFVNRVRATAFDARRNERATATAIETIAKTHANLQKVLASLNEAPDAAVAFCHKADLLDEIAALEVLLKFLQAQSVARYERAT